MGTVTGLEYRPVFLIKSGDWAYFLLKNTEKRVNQNRLSP